MAMDAGAISIRRLGAMHAVAEAARKVACSGATPVAATNCLNFGNPEKPHIMWQFSQMIDGITKACEELGDSDHGRQRQLLQRDAGRRNLSDAGAGRGGNSGGRAQGGEDALRRSRDARSCYCAASEAGDITDAETEFGSSEYAKEILGTMWGYPPELDLEKEAALQRAVDGADLRRTGRVGA